MVKQVGDKCIFEAKWTDTVEGAVHKYPNDHSTNVASVDVLERFIDQDGNLISKKMIRTVFNPNPVMKQVMSIFKMPSRTHQTSLELNKLDVGRKYFQLKSLNKTYFNSLRCFEVLEYNPDVENPDHTELNQSTWIDMYANKKSLAIRWAVHKGESVFAQQYIQTSRTNRQGLQDVINNLQLEWAVLAKNVATDFAKDAEKIGNKIFDKTSELGSQIGDKTVEIVDKSVEISQIIGQEIVDTTRATTNATVVVVDKAVDKAVEVGREVVDITVDKTVEMGKVAVDEGAKMVKSVESVLRRGKKSDGDDEK